jgi:hypothetical protein
MFDNLNDEDAKRANTPMFTPGIFEVTLAKVVQGKNSRTHVPNLVIECEIQESSTPDVYKGSSRCQIYSMSSDYFKQNARAFFLAAVRAQAKAKGQPEPADDVSLSPDLLRAFVGEKQPLRGLKLKVVAEAGKDPKYTNVRFSAL